MSQVADDLSVAWHQACDLVRSRLPMLAANHSVWLLPSLESALLEVSQVLLDRNAEMGGAKTKALFVRGQDPAFEVLASALSASGLDTRFCTIDEFRTPAATFDSIKNEALFSVFAVNSRFTGEVFDFAQTRNHILASGSKTAVLRVGFEQSFDEAVKPEPWEISLNVLWSGAVIVVLGERFRVLAKAAPYLIPRNHIEKILTDFEQTIALSKSFSSSGAQLRTFIETLESNLPKPFSALHKSGANRLLDRAIFFSQTLDGSLVCERLRAQFGEDSDLFSEMGIVTTSGCWDAESAFKRADERRQDWLRNNRRVWSSVLEIRGTIQIPLKTLVAWSPEKILSGLSSIAFSGK